MRLHMKTFTCLAIFCLLLWSNTNVSAQSSIINVSPSIMHLSTRPGSIFEVKVAIDNQTSREKLKAELKDFELGNNAESISPTNLNSIANETNGIGMHIDNVSWGGQLSLAKNRVTQVPVRFNIAPHVRSGDYYRLIEFWDEPQEPTKEGVVNVRNHTGIGVAVLLSVFSGGEQIKAKISQVAVGKENMMKIPFVGQVVDGSSALPVRVSIANEGNHLFFVNGTMVIKDMFGRETKTSLNEVIVLSASSKSLFGQSGCDSICRDSGIFYIDGFRLGPYTLQAKLDIGSGKKTLTESTQFFALPFKQIKILLGLICVPIVVFLFMKLRKNR